MLLLVKGKVRPEMFSLPIGQFNANARLCHLDIGVNSETSRSQDLLRGGLNTVNLVHTYILSTFLPIFFSANVVSLWH